jgi:hypothetical protein
MPHAILGTPEPDAAIYARIGRIAAEWSWLEKLLDEMLAHFCRADPGSMYVITQSAANSNVVAWLRVLTQIHIKNPETATVLIDLFNEIDAIRAERNTVVHGLWRGHADAEFATVHTLRWDRQEVARDELWSASDLDALIADVQRMQLTVGNIGLKFGFIKAETS